jgi:hypothetical protein
MAGKGDVMICLLPSSSMFAWSLVNYLSKSPACLIVLSSLIILIFETFSFIRQYCIGRWAKRILYFRY